MTWRQRKFLRNGTHLLVLSLVLLTLLGAFYGFWDEAAVATGAISMALLLFQFRRLLTLYYDFMCRLEVYLPAANGLFLGCLVLAGSDSALLAGIAVAQMTAWLGILAAHLSHRRFFVKRGPGLMPANVWWNPPAEAIKPGDIILMDGVIARGTRNSVGHVEFVVEHRGKLCTVSAYFEKGIVLFKTVRALLRVQENLKLGWAVIRPVDGFTPEQNRLAIEYAQAKHEANRKRVERDRPRAKARLDALLPDSFCQWGLLGRFMPQLKAWIWSKTEPTGYDRVSYRIGTHQRDLWTCKWIVEQTAKHAGIPVEEHESGALGLGTGLLNPPYPLSLMQDAAFRLLDTADRDSFLAQSGGSASGQ